MGVDGKVYSWHVLNSVLQSTPAYQTPSGARHGAGHRRQRESALWELTVHEGRGNPTHCTVSADQVHWQLGTQVPSGPEERKIRKERCQTHLSLEVSLKSREDHLAGEGADGDAWQQQWHSKVLSCVEGLTHSRTAKGEADTQFTKSSAQPAAFSLCCAFTGSHRSI